MMKSAKSYIKTWNDNEIKKHRSVQNAQNIGLADTVFEKVVSDMSFIETCNFLRLHAIRLVQQYRKKVQERFTILASHPIRIRREMVKGINASNLPNQYARVKNVAKGE
jgi:hypothetical protein